MYINTPERRVNIKRTKTVSKETYYSAKETYYSVKRDLLQCQKRPTAVSKIKHIHTTSLQNYF